MFGRDNVIAANLPMIASENFAGDTVVIHFERGTYFSLRGSAGTIWSLLQAPTSIAGIVAALDGQIQLPSKGDRGWLGWPNGTGNQIMLCQLCNKGR